MLQGPLRVLVFGGRGWRDRALVNAALLALHRRYGVAVLIHGNGDGADRFGAEWGEAQRADGQSIEVLPFGAEWKTQGLSAGPRRNARMLAEGRPQVAVGFPGGPGTADMTRRLEEAGVPIWWPQWKPNPEVAPALPHPDDEEPPFG